jgi:hypothetical protein
MMIFSCENVLETNIDQENEKFKQISNLLKIEVLSFKQISKTHENFSQYIYHQYE